MTLDFLKILQDRPVIAAFRDVKSLCIETLDRIGILLILGGSIFDLPSIVESARKHLKMVFVDIDLLKGIGRDSAGIRFLSRESKVDGIISTQGNLIKSAKQEGLFSIQRIFILDSESLAGSLNAVSKSGPDAIDILPGIILPKIISKIRLKTSVPLIAGGLINEEEDILEILAAGASGISTTNQRLFNFDQRAGRFDTLNTLNKPAPAGGKRIYCTNQLPGRNR